MIINGQTLLEAAPIKNMLPTKQVAFGMTYGCSEAGYDIRIKQEIRFYPVNPDAEFKKFRVMSFTNDSFTNDDEGRFTIASAIEEFHLPANLLGRVCDKSSWARKGLSVFNTVIEPGFKGGLTLELGYHGNTELIIPAGAPIAQVLFEVIKNPAQYNGKYQFQSTDPTPARHQEI